MLRLCVFALAQSNMGRKVSRSPVTLDTRDVTQLSDEEIRVILRGADDLIMSGGRSLLARVLKGSKQKAVLQHALDQSPVYGALSDLSIVDITARIDWLIRNGYLNIAYDYRLPLLVYTERGWAIERETYATELVDKIDVLLTRGEAIGDRKWLTEGNPAVLQRVLEKIAETGDRRYLPLLRQWQDNATRRISTHIRAARRAIDGNNQ